MTGRQTEQQAAIKQSMVGGYDEVNLLMDPDRFNHITYNEQYLLRKETIGFGMDLTVKKLYREGAAFKQQYKRRVAEQKDGKVELDYDQYPIKKEFLKLRELYGKQSKSNFIMKKNLEKLRTKVDKVTRDIKLKDFLSLKESDLARVTRPGLKAPQPQPPQPPTHRQQFSS